MPSRKRGPKASPPGIELADKYFLSLLSGTLKNTIFVPREVRALGGLSLKNLALVSMRHGTPADTAGHTRILKPSWLPNIELQSHVDINNKLVQVALKGTQPEDESSMVIHRFDDGASHQSRVLNNSTVALPPMPLRNPEHLEMQLRRSEITYLAQSYITQHVFLKRPRI